MHCLQKRELMEKLPAKLSEGDVECFSEYMEMWIHSRRIEGLRLWLSGTLQIEVNLESPDLILQLSTCGFSLHKDTDRNYIFRVSYTGCFVQQLHDNNVLVLNLVERISRFGGRTHSFMMKCPVVSVLPNREYIKCDPEYIQVTRQIPHDSWNNDLDWSLSLRGNLVVAAEDASLIQMNIDMTGPDITVQGRRRELLSPVKVMDKSGEFLALKLVSGQYAYSMEATCPDVTEFEAGESVLNIFKRRMGLTKRGDNDTETLTIRSVSVNQTDKFTVHETKDFVQLIIPTGLILQTKLCTDNTPFWQPFYRVDVEFTFKEMQHKMHWTMENTLPCTAVKPTVPCDTFPPIEGFSAPSFTTPALEGLTTEQPLEETSAVPVMNSTDATPTEETSIDISTTSSPYAETETTGFNFHINETSRSPSEKLSAEFVDGTLTTNETKPLGLKDVTDASDSTQLEFHLGSSDTTKAPAESYLTVITTDDIDTKNTTELVDF